MIRVLVNEAMTKKVITIDKNETVIQASNIYRDLKIGCLIVTDNGKVAGIITERDIIERTICDKRDPATTKVQEIMSSDIKTIHGLDKLEDAMEIMAKNNIKKLPVIKDGDIIGIITVTDVSRARPELSKRFIDSWVKSKWLD